MHKRLLTSMLLAVVCAWRTAAFADAMSVAKTISESFARAANAGDVAAITALYSDDATIIWPGAGEEAKGKPAIERLLHEMLSRPSRFVLKSLDAT